MRLDALGARQQREARAVERTGQTVPRAQAESRRYLTLQRFEREQRLEVDRARTAGALADPDRSGDAVDSAGPSRLPDRRRPGRIEPAVPE